MKKIQFVRHGQTNGNLKSLFHGQTDEPLNENGKKQAHNIASQLKKLDIEEIYCSPLKRTHETAQIISEYINKPLTIVNEFKELYFGKLEGKVNPDPLIFLNKWKENKIDENLQVESLENLKQRIAKGLKTILEKKDFAFIVSHGMVYYGLCNLLNIDYIDINNCNLRSHQIDFEDYK